MTNLASCCDILAQRVFCVASVPVELILVVVPFCGLWHFGPQGVVDASCNRLLCWWVLPYPLRATRVVALSKPDQQTDVGPPAAAVIMLITVDGVPCHVRPLVLQSLNTVILHPVSRQGPHLH
jgi:hypothetical protein